MPEHSDSATGALPSSPRRRGRPAVGRGKLLDAASVLFEQEGFHAVGIDRILSEAGVAKMTLYKNFASKQELIRAVLERRSARFLSSFAESLERRAPPGRGRLLAVFDELADWFARGDFHGCLFARAAAEFPAADDPLHLLSAEHKRAFLKYLTGLAEAAGAPSPRLLAQRLLLLVEGATVLAQVLGSAEAARQGRDTAALLLRQMVPSAGEAAGQAA